MPPEQGKEIIREHHGRLNAGDVDAAAADSVGTGCATARSPSTSPTATTWARCGSRGLPTPAPKRQV
jgi:hypothetical protein